MNSGLLRITTRRGLLALAVCALGSTAVAAPVHLTEAWLTVESPAVLHQIESEHRIVIDHGRVDRADGAIEQRILGTAEALEGLRTAGFEWVIRRSPRVESDGGYSSPSEGDTALRALVATSPRAGIVQMGSSSEGRPLLAAWFGQPPGSGSPDVRVLGAHHGDEWSSFEVALDIAELLATEDGTRTEVTALLDARTVWVAPYINPDGVVYGTRHNANDVDLNRNYDFHWSSSAYLSGPAPFSESETRAVRAHALTTAPPLSLSLHSGATNAGYVWNYSLTDVPERPSIAALADGYADLCTDPDFWVTNGAEWYRTWGDTNDWSHGRYGGMDFTIELTLDKAPPSSQIPTYTAHHREAVLGFLTTPLTLSGQVTDSSGNGLRSELQLMRNGQAASRPFLTDLDGRFARHTELDGTELVVRAPGYGTAQVQPGMALDIAIHADTLSTELSGPGRLPAAGGRVELDAPDGAATLSQPGHASLSIPIREGLFTVPELAGGAWTLTDAAGQVYPRMLLVEDSGPASRSRSAVEDGELVFEGINFTEGSQVWALDGDSRLWVDVELLSETSTEIVADAANFAATGDFLTLTNGTWLAHTRRTEGPDPKDTGAPADSGDTGETGIAGDSAADTGPDEPVRPACGCANSPAPWPALGFLALLAIRRRRS
ncbi:MAG: hypothetical protein KC912_17150 [Proteobacteria bacterium]|nr:hypothetical protein [Pseudomonadota bacterium]